MAGPQLLISLLVCVGACTGDVGNASPSWDVDPAHGGAVPDASGVATGGDAGVFMPLAEAGAEGGLWAPPARGDGGVDVAVDADAGDTPIAPEAGLVADAAEDADEGADAGAVEQSDAALPEPPPSKEFDPGSKRWVFLMAGQSNMAGTAPVQAEDREAPPRVYRLTYNHTWAPGSESFAINQWNGAAPANVGVLATGPCRAFAMAVLERVTDPEVEIYIVNAAVSGSAIESWDPATGANWNQMLTYLQDGLEMGALAGFVWHQGEANSGMASEEYASRLSAIVKAVRDRVGNPSLPFVAGEVGTTSDDGSRVNIALAQIAAQDSAAAVATSEGLTLADNVHYDAPSQRVYGARYAQRFWELVDARGSAETP